MPYKHILIKVPDHLDFEVGGTIILNRPDWFLAEGGVMWVEPTEPKPYQGKVGGTYLCWDCNAPILDKGSYQFCRVCRDHKAPGTLIRQYAQDDVKIEPYPVPGTWRINYDQGEAEPRPDTPFLRGKGVRCQVCNVRLQTGVSIEAETCNACRNSDHFLTRIGYG